MMRPALTVLISGLNWPYPNAAQLAKHAKLPALNRLRGRARRSAYVHTKFGFFAQHFQFQCKAEDCTQKLTARMLKSGGHFSEGDAHGGYDQDWTRQRLSDPSMGSSGGQFFEENGRRAFGWDHAALEAHLDQLLPKAGEVWLRVSPVHVYAAQDGLHLAGTEILTISQAEADAIIASLNELFHEDGWTFFAPSPARWYVKLPKRPRVQFTPLELALTQPLSDVMPQGEDEAFWRKVFNEIQMLLFTHSVNQAREGANETLINSIWFSGVSDGRMISLSTPFDMVLSDQFSSQALAHAAMIPFDTRPYSFSAFEERLHEWDVKHVLLELEWLEHVAIYEDAQNWLTRIHELEQHWFAPMLRAFLAGNLPNLSIISPCFVHDLHPRGEIWRLTSKDRFAFWRRDRSLSESL